MTTPKKSRAHPTSPPAATRSKSGWLIASLLVLAAFALYGKGLHYPLVFDNRVFRDDVFRHYTAAIFKLDTRWFAYATFGWTWEIVGKQWAWHRAINVLLHAGAAFMLFQFLSRLYTIALDTKGAANPQHTQWRWIAAMGALLFLVHPVAVYGVAYLTQRSIVMATLFGLLSLWLFLEGLARRQSPAWFYGAVATYFVAVFSKEHSVMIPAVALALIAGIDTTWSALGSSILHLANNSVDRRRLVENPSMIAQAIEEFLRAYAPVTMARVVTEDMEFHGVHMKKEDWVLLPFPAANRDENEFPNADTVDIDREINRHTAFGLGIHRCIGSNLARLELNVAIEVFLERFPDFERDQKEEVKWSLGQVRGPRKLPLRILARS